MKSLVIIPTYNEKENIEKLIPQIINLDEKINVLIVDDDSPDGTGDIADKLKEEFFNRVFVIRRKGKLGFASAYIEGFHLALSMDVDYIISMDADFSHNPRFLPELISKLKNYDVVVGSRYMYGTVSVVNWPIKRLILSRLANLYAKIVTGLKVNDCTSGFAGYRREVLEKIGIENILSDGYSFLIEMKYRAQRKGYKLGEVPIIFEERRLGQSKMSKKIIFEALFRVWQLKVLP
ncbi:MAG: polyprenol monophosphomannose synthase [bacterium]|nr:polyprenol monophosphomannose synthase [bacterium]